MRDCKGYGSKVMEDLLAYGGMFAVAFLAATLLPAQSEAALVGLLMTGRYHTLFLLAAAGAGNVLGSCVNYAIGHFLAKTEWFRRIVSEKRQLQAENWYRRYGWWSLLGSWIPIVGDPLTAVAGALREPFAVFLVLVTIAKVGRYLVVIALHEAWFSE
jgi:membrane protein YqaA with SNARE-associated domain